ncbi:MAG: DedA family protein [Burkholderiales bacterium PBB3]|nr:MAG: DedA family protein [Burkholderiales bacterium PBB3]
MTVFNALLPIFTEYGYIAVFVMLLICGFGVPLPEDVTLVTGGVIAGLGYANEHNMVAVGLAGVMLGDGLIFLGGRFFGDGITRVKFFKKLLTPERYCAVQNKFAKYGRWVMFVARFLPGLRTPVFLTAGMSRRVSFPTWLLMDGFAALISVPVWVYLGFYSAKNIDGLFDMVHRGQHILLGLLVLGAAVGVVYWWRSRQRSRPS